MNNCIKISEAVAESHKQVNVMLKSNNEVINAKSDKCNLHAFSKFMVVIT